MGGCRCSVSVYGVGDVERILRRAGKGYVLGVKSDHHFGSWSGKPAVARLRRSLAILTQVRGNVCPPVTVPKAHDFMTGPVANWPILTQTNITRWERGSGPPIFGRGASSFGATSATVISHSSRPGAQPEQASKTLVSVEGHRWAIEDSFETAKNEFGLDHTKPARGMAGIVTSLSSCSPLP